MQQKRTVAAAVVLVISLLFAMPLAAQPTWQPSRFENVDTLEFSTIAAGEDEDLHWAMVWLVVLDDQVYIRLGSRAADRITGNTQTPYVGIKIAGQEFTRVRAEATPEMADRVAEAMADKYWSDIFVRFFSHPLTMRLVPAD